MKLKSLNIIEILWDGPFTINEAKKLKLKKDRGVYQIYGTHIINGANSLLYIGQTVEQTFALRFTQHESDWIKDEYEHVRIYVGRILQRKDQRMHITKWKRNVALAEKLMIYYCPPSYNSQSIHRNTIKAKNIMILNYGKKHLLPNEITTLWFHSEFWDKKYKPFNT